MKNFNEYSIGQMNSFMSWVLSDNVVFEDGIYRSQCNQYVSKMTYGEILLYWWKEYGQYEEWVVEEEIENNFRR